MGSSKLIQVEQVDGQACITLNRPDRANALTGAMLTDMVDAVADAQNAKVLILRGAGNVFSAGADLDEVSNGRLATDPNWERLSAAIAGFKGLTVAELNGTVAGGAMGMVLACDLRFCVPTAKFFYPALAKGVDPQPSDPARCAALVGPSRTAELFLLGRKINSTEALTWGLVNGIVDCDELTAIVNDHGQSVLCADADRVTRIKAMIAGEI